MPLLYLTATQLEALAVWCAVAHDNEIQDALDYNGSKLAVETIRAATIEVTNFADKERRTLKMFDEGYVIIGASKRGQPRRYVANRSEGGRYTSRLSEAYIFDTQGQAQGAKSPDEVVMSYTRAVRQAGG